MTGGAGSGAGATVIVSVAVAVPAAFVALTVTRYTPAVVGVPEIALLVGELAVIPAGKSVKA